MTDHYLNRYHKKGTPFYQVTLNSLPKYWKKKYYLNIGKRIQIFLEFSDGFIDFNKWKNDHIDGVMHAIFSKSNNAKRKIIMNDLMNDLLGKVIHVVDKHTSIFMTEQEIRYIIRGKFKNHVSYKVIKSLIQVFGRTLMIHGVNIYPKMLTHRMI